MMEKDLPSTQKSQFMYHMLLLFIAAEMRLLGKIPKGLILELGTDQTSSLLATLIVEVDELEKI